MCENLETKIKTLEESALTPRQLVDKSKELSKCVNWCKGKLARKYPKVCNADKENDEGTLGGEGERRDKLMHALSSTIIIVEDTQLKIFLRRFVEVP